MGRFSDASIKRKLTLIIMGISVVSVLLTTIALSVIGIYNLQRDAEDQLDVSATITADRNRAAIDFGDREAASQNLEVFSVNPSIRRACLYDASAYIFTSYFASDYKGKKACPAINPAHKVYDEKTGNLRIFQQIVDGSTLVGYVMLESDLHEINAYIRKLIITACMVALATFGVSYLLARILQGAISKPILTLAKTAEDISIHQDYSIRAYEAPDLESESKNELSLLIRAFNSMLSEIEERDRQLLLNNAELKKAKEEAESSNRAKSHFLANISHELRTPLNAIIGFSSILLKESFGPLSDKYKEYSKDINDAGIHLLDIINDILDLSKAEAGRLILSFDEFNIAQAVKKCVTLVSERAEAGNVTLHFQLPDRLAYIVADRLRFIQIVLNILSNAVKFTKPGGHVTLNVRSGEPVNGASDLFIIIADTGIGMAPEHLEKVFQSFGQIDSGLNRKYEGTGLGLALTKRLIEMHHGSITIDSELGKGTTVTLFFPANQQYLKKKASSDAK